ncbi:HNH endonuclease signature motif containing protein [Streptomyces sp. NRRL F-2747]|uniref:HNH endonuclease signature motif containing protein n=1 Tax=Streptomyces sp. NRRL F-2747 TaxID=1463843 RepID=UPI0006922A99|nr:HNH endonuclease signature motif containing protein [Streptomyces sp. NRRL F-2747]
MWPLKVPLLKPIDSFLACVATSAQADGRRKKLLGAKEVVREAGQELRRAASSRTVHALQKEDWTVEGMSAGEFVEWAYGNGMKTVTGRKIRDILMAAPRDERCPMCSTGIVRQLDHVMPKSHFPALCVDPLNLVPVCEHCNLLKGNKHPSTAEETLLHPYLDRISHDRWLDARTVHEHGMVRLEFFVTPPAPWDTTLTSRVRNHFDFFDLGKLYASEANRAITGMTYHLTLLRASGGAAVVQRHLRETAASWFASDPNSVTGVTYATLAADDRYCQG